MLLYFFPLIAWVPVCTLLKNKMLRKGQVSEEERQQAMQEQAVD